MTKSVHSFIEIPCGVTAQLINEELLSEFIRKCLGHTYYFFSLICSIPYVYSSSIETFWGIYQERNTL